MKIFAVAAQISLLSLKRKINFLASSSHLIRMIITLGYDAISKNVEGLGTSPFILFSMSASAILPACVILLLLQDRIGRKAMASSSLLVSGIFTAGTGIVLAYQTSYPDPMLLAILSIIGRFGVTIAYNSGDLCHVKKHKKLLTFDVYIKAPRAGNLRGLSKLRYLRL